MKIVWSSLVQSWGVFQDINGQVQMVDPNQPFLPMERSIITVFIYMIHVCMMAISTEHRVVSAQ